MTGSLKFHKVQFCGPVLLFGYKLLSGRNYIIFGMQIGIDNKNKLSRSWHPAETNMCCAGSLQVKSRHSGFRDLSVHTSRRTWLNRLG